MDNKMDIIPAFMKLSVEKTWLKGKPKKKKKKKCNDFKETQH